MLPLAQPHDLERIFRNASTFRPFPPISRRDAWQSLYDAAPADCDSLIAEAKSIVGRPIHVLLATDFLHFSQTGDRKVYEHKLGQRRGALNKLIVAECLTNTGEFRDSIINHLWAVCEESTWCLPAHIHSTGDQHDLPDVTRPIIDLMAAMTAHELATAHVLLSSILPQAVNQRITDEIETRIFQPFEQRMWHWLDKRPGDLTNNWSSVCAAGVLCAAMVLLPDPARLASMFRRALPCLEGYLDTFDSEGGSSEGVAYWDYGFGHFVMLADDLLTFSNGQINWFTDPRVRTIAQFPLHTYLGGGHWLSFADSGYHHQPAAWLLASLAHHTAQPQLLTLVPRTHSVAGHHLLQTSLRHMQSRASLTAHTSALPLPPNSYLRTLQWFVSRINPADDAALSVAIKGGHNGEMHNNDDVGSFIIHLSGSRLLTDPGSGRYTRDYFNSPNPIFTKQSLSHSVPMIDRRPQATGSASAARVLHLSFAEHADSITLDLTAAYPGCDLQSLTRSLVTDRTAGQGRGQITLTDEFAFTRECHQYQSVLISLCKPELGNGEIIFRDNDTAIRVAFDPAICQANLDIHENVAYNFGDVTLYRTILTPAPPTCAGRLVLTIEPM